MVKPFRMDLFGGIICDFVLRDSAFGLDKFNELMTKEMSEVSSPSTHLYSYKVYQGRLWKAVQGEICIGEAATNQEAEILDAGEATPRPPRQRG